MNKKIFYYIAATAGLSLFCSCQGDEIDDIKGVFTPPTAITATKLNANERTTDPASGLREFTLDMSDGKDGLHAVFIGNNWKLGAGTYSPAASVSKAGTYLTTGTYFYVGGKQYTPTSGTVIVTNDGADGYTFSAMLFSKDFDGAASVSFSGTIAYEKEYKNYTTCITASKQGENAVQIVLGTDGMAGSFDMSKFQWVYTGTGDVMTLVLYSPDGKLHAGTYTPCPAEGEVAEGTFKHGFLNTQYAQYGVTFADGSFTSSYNNGTKGADTYITDGSIEVSVDGTSYTITVDGTATSARYKGNLPL